MRKALEHPLQGLPHVHVRNVLSVRNILSVRTKRDRQDVFSDAAISASRSVEAEPVTTVVAPFS